MPISYPAITPSSLEFIPATYDIASPSYKNLVVSPRPRASKPSGPILRLSYNNIQPEEILAILTAWDNSYSGYFTLTLPNSLVAGVVSTDFAGRIVSPKTTDWRFKERPTPNRFTAGVASISVTLVGEIFRPDVPPAPSTT